MQQVARAEITDTECCHYKSQHEASAGLKCAVLSGADCTCVAINTCAE